MASSVTDPLTEGAHSFTVDGRALSYHVHGTGPVCVAHSGGPGINWGYLRSEELERHLTMVYVEPVGTGGATMLTLGSVANCRTFARVSSYEPSSLTTSRTSTRCWFRIVSI